MKLIFDFGGVVFRWQPVDFLRAVLPQQATSDAAVEALREGFFQSYGGDWGEFDRGAIEPAPLAQRIAGRTGLAVEEVARVIDAVPAWLRPMPDTVALLRELRDAGHRLYFLSNMPAPYADYLERHHDFLRWFDDGLFSARIRLIKPDPAIFDHALRQFGGPAERCVFFDDHPANIEAAARQGWQARQFTTAEQARRDLGALGLQRA